MPVYLYLSYSIRVYMGVYAHMWDLKILANLGQNLATQDSQLDVLSIQ